MSNFVKGGHSFLKLALRVSEAFYSFTPRFLAPGPVPALYNIRSNSHQVLCGHSFQVCVHLLPPSHRGFWAESGRWTPSTFLTRPLTGKESNWREGQLHNIFLSSSLAPPLLTTPKHQIKHFSIDFIIITIIHTIALVLSCTQLSHYTKDNSTGLESCFYIFLK